MLSEGIVAARVIWSVPKTTPLKDAVNVPRVAWSRRARRGRRRWSVAELLDAAVQPRRPPFGRYEVEHLVDVEDGADELRGDVAGVAVPTSISWAINLR